MCLIFVRNSFKEPLNYEALQQAYKDNPDGVGVLWWNEGWKDYRSIECKYADLEKFLDKLDSCRYTWAVHFRWATAGKVNKRNCHPFSVGNGGYLMHNGVLPYTPTRKERSDTWQFAQWVSRIGINNFDYFEDLFKEATRGSRMLYALPDGSLRYSGDWVHKPEGYYSNSRCFFNTKASSYSSWKGQSQYTNWRRNEVQYHYKNETYPIDDYSTSPCSTGKAEEVEYADLNAEELKALSIDETQLNETLKNMTDEQLSQYLSSIN